MSLSFFLSFSSQNCGLPGQPLCDSCHHSWIPVFFYLVVNVIYNVFGLLIVKHGGAALSFVISTMRLPLTTVCFYSKAIVGVDATQPTVFDFIGMLVLIGGLGIYRAGAAIVLESEEGDAADEFGKTMVYRQTVCLSV